MDEFVQKCSEEFLKGSANKQNIRKKISKESTEKFQDEFLEELLRECLEYIIIANLKRNFRFTIDRKTTAAYCY